MALGRYGFMVAAACLASTSAWSQAALWVADYGYDASAGSWRVESHPRLMGDVNRDGMADVVAFGGPGVYVSLSTGTSFTPRSLWVQGYGADTVAGGWQVSRHPRMLADVNGDGRQDIVGFASGGVWVSLSTGTAFTPGSQWLAGVFGFDAGWRLEQHLRFLADVNGDGRADIVGFGDAGVYVSLSTGSSFTVAKLAVQDFGYYAGGWRVELHPRFLADVNYDGAADIVGFSDIGVHVSTALGGGLFSLPTVWSREYGRNTGWQVDRHPRFVQDMNRDGRADVIGFHDDGVSVALSNGWSAFGTAQAHNSWFGYNAGWRVDQHPRMLAETDGDGRPDIVGFASNGAHRSASLHTLFDGTHWSCEFGVERGWRIDRHPRMVVDVTGDGLADIVGFANAGVYVMNAPNLTSYGTSCASYLGGRVGIVNCDTRRVQLQIAGVPSTFGFFAVGTSRIDVALPRSCRLLTSAEILLSPTDWGLAVGLTVNVPAAIQAPLYCQFLGYIASENRVFSSNGVIARL